MVRTTLIAVGANLPDSRGRTPLETCRWAVERLALSGNLRLVATSRWYRTSPVPASDQPDYINGVVRLAGNADPHALLASLHTIEAEAGRTRGERNAARVLDLDLLALDDLVIEEPGLILPHPRLAERAFVLVPLGEVAPEWRHPVLGRTARELLEVADRSGIRPI